MRLGVDLSPFYTESRYRGIGRYARGLLQELIRIDETDSFHFFNSYGAYAGDPPMNRQCYLHNYFCGPVIEHSGGKLLLDNASFENYFHATVDHYLQSSKIDAMLFLSLMEVNRPFQIEWFSGVYKIGILYDLIPLVFQEEYLKQESNRRDYMAALELLRKMDLLLAISETSKNDAVNLLGIPEDKIIVINAGVDDQFLAAANEAHLTISQKMQKADPYVLFIGGMDSRKNIDKAIQAFALNRAARERGVRFVVAGRSSAANNAHLTGIVRRYGVQDRVIFPGYVRDEDVAALYQNALALLFPSRYEGFGLPVIEAMCCGTAVITSNTSSLVEVAEGYAYLVEPDSVESISDGITALLTAGQEAEAQITTAKTYAMTFRWQRVAQISRDAIVNLGVRAKPEQNKANPLCVESDMLRAIAKRYSQMLMPFSWMDALKTAKALRRLERGTEEDGIRQGTRILYDITALSADAKANTPEIARIRSLMRALMSYAEVVPVSLKRSHDQISFVQIDEKTRITGKTLIPYEGDIYLLPELRLDQSINPLTIQAVRAMGVKPYAVVFETTQPEAENTREALQNFDGILTVSRIFADELLQSIRSCPVENSARKRPYIGVFPFGVDRLSPKNARTDRSIQRLFRGKSPIFLVTEPVPFSIDGSLAIQAFSQLWREGVACKLCILNATRAGKDAIDANDMQKAAYPGKIWYLDCADDLTKQYALQHATALIEPSYDNGDGLTMLEAASNRLPIICSKTPGHFEIAGEHAMYFSQDVDSLAQCVREFLRLRELGQVSNSSKIDLYTWDEAANCISAMVINNTGWTYRE